MELKFIFKAEIGYVLFLQIKQMCMFGNQEL